MEDEQIDQEQPAPELLQQATEMGWRPKEEFKGSEEKWVDAKTFVERGEHVLPIVKANADRLRKENAVLHDKTAALETAVEDGRKAIAALEKYHQEDVKQKVDAARTKIKAELVAAKKSGDVEAEVELTESLGKLNAADDAATTRDDTTTRTDTRKQDEVDHTRNPDFLAWKEENPWFGPQGDRAKSAIAYQVHLEIKQDSPGLKGRAYLDEITRRTNAEVARLTGGRAAPARKVEGGKGGAGGSAGGNGAGKSYADLPADAKAACSSFTRDLVGPNKRHKTEAEWQKAYATQYFAEV